LISAYEFAYWSVKKAARAKKINANGEERFDAELGAVVVDEEPAADVVVDPVDEDLVDVVFDPVDVVELLNPVEVVEDPVEVTEPEDDPLELVDEDPDEVDDTAVDVALAPPINWNWML